MPMIQKEKFYRVHEKKKDDTFTVKFNDEERKEFESFKNIIQQKKDSTAIKQLAWIGSKVVLEEKSQEILKIVLNNYRKNKRNNIIDFD